MKATITVDIQGIEEFTTISQKFVKDGWEHQGGVSMGIVPGEAHWYAQTFVKLGNQDHSKKCDSICKPMKG